MDDNKTRRKKMIEMLEKGALTAGELSSFLSLEKDLIYEEIKEISKSLPEDKTLYGSQPTCRECGFDNFDNVINNPSKCPNCYSTSLEDIKFKVE